VKLQEAKEFRDRLNRAIAKAESEGSDTVSLSQTAAAMDDAARAELDAAIKEHHSYGR
jgi:hypothetical protein